MASISPVWNNCSNSSMMIRPLSNIIIRMAWAIWSYKIFTHIINIIIVIRCSSS